MTFIQPIEKIYPDLKFKNTTIDLDCILPCCSRSVIRAYKENDLIPEGRLVECDECEDGMALFNGKWSAVFKTQKTKQ